MLSRVLQGTVAPITASLLNATGDVPSPLPDTATVTITRSDGSLVADAAVATSLGSDVFRYDLTPTDTAVLDVLTVAWNAPAVGTTTTTVEVVGGFLFTVAEARALAPLSNTTSYTTDQIVAMRTIVEDTIEEYTGALVPRYTVQTATTFAVGTPITLKAFPRLIRTLSIDGVASTDLTSLSLLGGYLANYTPSPYGTVRACHRRGITSVVTVGYEYGLDRPPERLRRAGLLLAKTWLVAGPIDDRTSTFSSSDGGTYSLVTPGLGGSIVGVPEVDAAIQTYARPGIA